MATLLVYSSKHGCTEDCSKMLKKRLYDDVSLVNMDETLVLDITDFDTIIIGSPIYGGQISSRIKEFYQQHFSTLLKKRIGLFLCCMLEGEKAEQQMQSAFPKELLKHAHCTKVFGGEFRFEDMNFFERFVVKTVTTKNDNFPDVEMTENVSTISKKQIREFVRKMNE